MADDGFKGTTFTFGGTTQGDITDLSFSQQADWVDLTDAADTDKCGIVGPVDKEFSMTVTGTSTITVGATGVTQIGWNDGTTSGNSSDTFQCHSSATSGSVGGKIATSLGFKKKA